jgi:septal ring factor EnvC (AmiA/AmiB activator)
MDARIAQLETHIDYMRENMAEFRNEMREFHKAQQETNKSIMELKADMQKLPTRDELWSFKIQWLAIILVGCVAIIAGIIGGLDWIKVH